MLTLTEDKFHISELIHHYLKDHTVQQWKFEELLNKLLNQDLQIEPDDTCLLELGTLYIEEIKKFNAENTVPLSPEDKEKIIAVEESISTICTAHQIKHLVKENNFACGYILNLKDNAIEASSAALEKKRGSIKRFFHRTKLSTKNHFYG